MKLPSASKAGYGALSAVTLVALLLFGGWAIDRAYDRSPPFRDAVDTARDWAQSVQVGVGDALDDLAAAVDSADAAPGTGRIPEETGDRYDRDEFGTAWADVDRNGCDTRNDILTRDLTGVSYRGGSDCVVIAGALTDPYTGMPVKFVKADADAVHIDHVVALSEAWQSGADGWSDSERLQFANDPANLTATAAGVNLAKSDRDAAEWVPPDPAARCWYARTVEDVKARYGLTTDPDEQKALDRMEATC